MVRSRRCAGRRDLEPACDRSCRGEARHPTDPCRVKRRKEYAMLRTILVGNDGSTGAMKAIQAAIDLAKREDAELHEICIEEPLPHYAASVGEVVEAEQEVTDYFRRV